MVVYIPLWAEVGRMNGSPLRASKARQFRPPVQKEANKRVALTSPAKLGQSEKENISRRQKWK